MWTREVWTAMTWSDLATLSIGEATERTPTRWSISSEDTFKILLKAHSRWMILFVERKGKSRLVTWGEIVLALLQQFVTTTTITITTTITTTIVSIASPLVGGSTTALVTLILTRWEVLLNSTIPSLMARWVIVATKFFAMNRFRSSLYWWWWWWWLHWWWCSLYSLRSSATLHFFCKFHSY